MTGSYSVALATYHRLPALNADDQLLADALRARGIDAVPARWDVPRDWSRFDAVVLRTCWDYYQRSGDFLAWIDEVEGSGARLLDPAPLVRWNADKRYLRELDAEAAPGVRVVPTAWVDDEGEEPTLARLLAAHGWPDAVVKPAVSAGAFETWRTGAARAADDEARFAALVARTRGQRGAVMVQPFVPEVVAEGEWSLVFVAGRYSHAVLKRAAAADFRVQVEHGGRWEPAAPPRALVDDAAAVLRAAAARTGVPLEEILYARVDGVSRAGRLLLMELECIEPFLFLAAAPDAARRLADAVQALLSTSRV